MKKWFPLFLVGFLISTADSCQHEIKLIAVDTKTSALNAANEANELYKKGDLEGAHRSYSVAIQADPKLFLAVYFRGEDRHATTQVGAGHSGL